MAYKEHICNYHEPRLIFTSFSSMRAAPQERLQLTCSSWAPQKYGGLPNFPETCCKCQIWEQCSEEPPLSVSIPHIWSKSVIKTILLIFKKCFSSCAIHDFTFLYWKMWGRTVCGGGGGFRLLHHYGKETHGTHVHFWCLTVVSVSSQTDFVAFQIVPWKCP